MAIKHPKVTLFYCRCWRQRFFSSQFCCEIRQFWWKKFIKLIKDKTEFDKIYCERNILFNLRQVIHIFTFPIVNLLCRGYLFSNVAFIDAAIKYRSPYILDVSWPYLLNHIRTDKVLGKFLRVVLRTLGGHVPLEREITVTIWQLE